jgi:predicted DNA-binding WGR domain protein
VKTFFFMGRNPENKSGVSWKMWKIERAGRTVTVFWGPVVLRKRRVVPSAKLQTKVFRLSSEATAKAFELARIESKLRSGYQRRPRRKVTRS